MQKTVSSATPFTPEILGMQHPAVITLGYRAHAENEILSADAIPTVKIDRGGLATIHSEGQLVIYPILQLSQYGLGVRQYVDLLLETTAHVLRQSYGISAQRDESGVGLFTAAGKIVFCGIKVKSGVTQHGLSINMKNDLALFRHIIPCGFQNPKFDKVENYVSEFSPKDFFDSWVKEFSSRLITAVI